MEVAAPPAHHQPLPSKWASRGPAGFQALCLGFRLCVRVSDLRLRVDAARCSQYKAPLQAEDFDQDHMENGKGEFPANWEA